MLYIDSFQKFISDMIAYDKIETIDFGGANGRGNVADIQRAAELGFNKEFLDHYSNVGFFTFSWRSKVPDTGKMEHTIRVKPLTHILEHKDCGLFHEDDLEMNPALEDFYVVDYFVNEACVGIFAGKHSTKTLYYNTQGEWETISIGLDLAGYYEMYLEAKGYFYWQKVIIQELILGKTIPAGDRMRRDLPLIFPGWSWENFVAKFKSLYIKELIP